MITLNNLKSPKGAHKNVKRIGRGPGSGRGTQAGKGHKGQKARTGGGVRTGFEGGSMPLYMRLPKRGFKNSEFKTEFAVINLSHVSLKVQGDLVSRETLIEAGLLNGANKRLNIKILNKGGTKPRALKFEGISAFSQSAKDSIIAAGGKIS